LLLQLLQVLLMLLIIVMRVVLLGREGDVGGRRRAGSWGGKGKLLGHAPWLVVARGSAAAGGSTAAATAAAATRPGCYASVRAQHAASIRQRASWRVSIQDSQAARRGLAAAATGVHLLGQAFHLRL
jgi:hypothetical protein